MTLRKSLVVLFACLYLTTLVTSVPPHFQSAPNLPVFWGGYYTNGTIYNYPHYNETWVYGNLTVTQDICFYNSSLSARFCLSNFTNGSSSSSSNETRFGTFNETEGSYVYNSTDYKVDFNETKLNETIVSASGFLGNASSGYNAGAAWFPLVNKTGNIGLSSYLWSEGYFFNNVYAKDFVAARDVYAAQMLNASVNTTSPYVYASMLNATNNVTSPYHYFGNNGYTAFYSSAANTSMLSTSGLERLRVNANGTLNITNQSRARAFLSDNQTNTFTTASGVKVTFNSTSFNTQGEFSTTNNRFTAFASGFYFVHAAIQWVRPTAASNYTLMIYKSGLEYSRNVMYNAAPVNVTFTHQITDLVYLNAGQYLEIYAARPGATIVVYLGAGSTLSWFDVHKLS